MGGPHFNAIIGVHKTAPFVKLIVTHNVITVVCAQRHLVEVVVTSTNTNSPLLGDISS